MSAEKRDMRLEVMTTVFDRLHGLAEREFEQASSYVDTVEIGWGLLLVWKEESIPDRVLSV